jgi:pimeloyl-ACP methyl ester carboxylesterase
MPRGTKATSRTRKGAFAPQALGTAPAVGAGAAAGPTVPLPAPIIVVPGNPAVNLLDLYLTTPDPAFTLSRGFLNKPSFDKNYDRLPFHPDDPATTLNLTGKKVTPARLAAINAFYLPYEDLVERLKKDIVSQDDPTPVFPFAYDWRFETTAGAQELDNFIGEVLRITSRLPMYKGSPPQKVDIVAHSFGGLVTARYLRSCQQAPVKPSRVRKVVTIASPFRGAVDAMFTMIKDLDQKEAARTLPSVYGLLPYFDRATVTKVTGQPIDLLTDPTVWTGSSVERSLDAYCIRMGSTKTGAARLQELRATAVQQRADLANLSVVAALGGADAWLPIVGTMSETNIQVVVGAGQGTAPGVEFTFVRDTDGSATGDQLNTGDGTVPFRGTVPAFNLATGAGSSPTPLERLVCFTEKDIGLHERGDWLGLGQMLGLASLHSFLPRMDAVQQVIIGFLRPTPPSFKAKAHPAPTVPLPNVRWPASWNVEAV